MFRLIFLFSGLAFFISGCQNSDPLTVTISGDVILDRGVQDKIRMYGDSILVNSIQRSGSSDFFLINFEGTFSDPGESQKDRFNFRSPERYAFLLKQGGVSHISVANNHSHDYLEKGYQQTLKNIQKAGIIPIGDVCEPVLLTKNGKELAILAASLTDDFDSVSQLLINQVMIHQTDFPEIPLILYLHYGLELHPFPDIRQKSLAKKLIQNGADCIVGHHPHVIQPVEWIHGKPVFYSVGNFVADAYLPFTTEGLIINLTVTDTISEIELVPKDLSAYLPDNVPDNKKIKILSQLLTSSANACVMSTEDKWYLRSIAEIPFDTEKGRYYVPYNDQILKIRALSSGGHVLTLLSEDGESNPLFLEGQLSDIRIGDVNNDGIPDLLIGIIKKVHFDISDRKRVNIFTIENGNLRALWLGTCFIFDVVSFEVIKANNYNYLKTTEIDSAGTYHEGNYRWDEFGFKLDTLKMIR